MCSHSPPVFRPHIVDSHWVHFHFFLSTVYLLHQSHPNFFSFTESFLLIVSDTLFSSRLAFSSPHQLSILIPHFIHTATKLYVCPASQPEPSASPPAWPLLPFALQFLSFLTGDVGKG